MYIYIHIYVFDNSIDNSTHILLSNTYICIYMKSILYCYYIDTYNIDTYTYIYTHVYTQTIYTHTHTYHCQIHIYVYIWKGFYIATTHTHIYIYICTYIHTRTQNTTRICSILQTEHNYHILERAQNVHTWKKNDRSLLQNIVSFIRLFCKRDL